MHEEWFDDSGIWRHRHDRGEVARQLIAAGERPRLLLRSPEKAGTFEGWVRRSAAAFQ